MAPPVACPEHVALVAQQDRSHRSRGNTPTGSYERGHGFGGKYGHANGVADKRKGGGGGFGHHGPRGRPSSHSPDRGFIAAAADKLAAHKLSGASPPAAAHKLAGASPPAGACGLPLPPSGAADRSSADAPAESAEKAGGAASGGDKPAADKATADKPAFSADRPPLAPVAEDTAAVKQAEGSISSVAARIAKLEVAGNEATSAAPQNPAAVPAPDTPARPGSLSKAFASARSSLDGDKPGDGDDAATPDGDAVAAIGSNGMAAPSQAAAA